ncbi:hypothetical protein HBB16_13490 [Pseudonocardia sp. MCCB 268]|nr:hypothetical protein [Pseudonocardia cytotoxica]
MNTAVPSVPASSAVGGTVFPDRVAPDVRPDSAPEVLSIPFVVVCLTLSNT